MLLGMLYDSKNSAAELKKKTKGKELDIVLQISKFLVRVVMTIVMLVLNYIRILMKYSV